MPVEPSQLLLELPLQAAQSDAELHAVAVRIFQIAQVRSVTVNDRRNTAVVRYRADAREDASKIDSTAKLLEAPIEPHSRAAGQGLELLSWIDPRDRSISFVRMPGRVRGWRKTMYLVLAGVALLLGLLGIVLPGLPTTPFVLLGSYFLVRSSQTLHERLMASRVFGGVLRDWYVHRGLRPHMRARAVAVVALVVAVSLVIARPPLPVVLAIVALAVCGLMVIWRLPSVREGGPSS
jgi:uncharacterized membrane protein YbaN (DUF454 family)